MKRPRYNKGRIFSKYFKYIKEHLYKFSHGGDRKDRMAFFECTEHKGSYFLTSHKRATTYKNKECPCKYFKKVLLEDINNYNYNVDQARRKKFSKVNEPGWLFTTKLGIFIKGKTKTDNLLWYRFDKENRSDYRIVRKLENETFTFPSRSKKMVLGLLEKQFKIAEATNKLTFTSDLWNLGDTPDLFEQLLIENDVQ